MTTTDQLLADIDDRDAEISSLRSDLDLQTKAAWDNHSKVAQLTAELAKVREQLTAANHHTDGLAADVRDMQKANTAYANENARLRTQLAEADVRPCNCCFVDGSTQRCGRTATTDIDVPPFGYLDVADACKARINGTEVAR